MAFATHTDTEFLVRNWPYDFQHIETGGEHYDYLSAFSTELGEIDDVINDLYDHRFIESSTGDELEKLGAEVGVTRQDGENDEQLQFRTLLRKSIAASNGTAQDIEQIIEVAFGESALETIEVTHSLGSPVIQFGVPQPILDDIPLARADFEVELNRAFPAGHGVNVVTSDTWLLGESGNQGLGEGGLI